mgnify:CR=1 FL=1
MTLYVTFAILVLALSLGVYLAWQSSLKPAPFDVMFEVRETGDTEISGRIVPLDGSANFRDLGGYRTSVGALTAWRRVFRSDDLSRLSDDDLTQIQSLGVRTICDLRSYPELRARPDRIPAGVEYVHIPIFTIDPIGRWRVLLMRHRLDALLKSLYRTSIIDRGAPAVGQALRLVADRAKLPLVIHCTGGKDRAGVVSALLLHVCGVPREMIVADYSLTNRSVEKFMAGIKESFSATTPPPGLKLEQMYPLLSARPELIEHAFSHIEATYSSVDAYLLGPAGLTEEELAAIRLNLLEKVAPTAL